jgi:hypothetical protein
MFYFRITKRQQELLIEVFKNNEIDFKYSFYFDYFVLESQSDIEKCFDYLLDYFVNNGLMQNDEPSEYGIEIENINQIINHQLVLNNSEKEFEKKYTTIYLDAKIIFFNCDGNIDDLDVEIKKIYKKYNIPNWLEENWLNKINNLKIEKSKN